MSEVKVNKISPRTNCGTVTLGDSGDSFVIPAGATITNNGTQTGFGRTGTVDWDTTAKTASFTAVSGEGYFCNTTSSAFTATLPAGSAGAIVSFADYAATWQTNNLTVSPDGTDKIGGTNADVTLSTEGQSVTFVYIDSTQGWINTMDSTSNVRASSHVAATGGTESTCGDFKIHTFTGPGTLCVSAAGSPVGSNTIEYIVVAGGGAGGTENNSSTAAGGAGAGGFRFASPSLSPVTYPGKPLAAPAGLTATVGAFPIVVGGGAAAPSCCSTANSGSVSTFSSITSAGGGAGGIGGSTPCSGFRSGTTGGSGGGGSHASSGSAGNTPPVSPAQGTAGGPTGPVYLAGGGGGAINCGAAGTASAAGNGGDGAGIPTAFGSNGVPCGSFRYYAGGGGGGGVVCRPESGPAGSGGKGGGAAGGAGNNSAPAAATTNSGGGGGGAGARFPAGARNLGSNGGSGIVIIRYKFQN